MEDANPYCGEIHFNLGLALETSERYEEAYDAFHKAVWSDETRGAGCYHLARIKAIRRKYSDSLEFANIALVRNWHDIKACGFIAAMNIKLQMRGEDFNYGELALDYLACGLYDDVIFILSERKTALWRTEIFPSPTSIRLGTVKRRSKRSKRPVKSIPSILDSCWSAIRSD